MRILLVGAGAVGQVFAHHLRQGGAEIGLYVRPHQAHVGQEGLTLYPLRRARSPLPAPERLTNFPVLTAPEAVDGRWDQLWLCVSSTALRRDEGIRALLTAIPPHTTVVTLQPGLADRAWLHQHLPQPERLVCGMIPFIAWQTPLPGEPPHAPPGILYWCPPFSAVPLQGAAARVTPIVQTLRAGGLTARAVSDLDLRLAAASALLTPSVAALEAADWSLSAFRQGPLVHLAAHAAREAMDISARYHGRNALPSRVLARPLLLQLAAGLAPAFVPFDLERYLRYHFTKVGDQTRDQLALWIETAAPAGLPTAHLQRLRDRLPLPNQIVSGR